MFVDFVVRRHQGAIARLGEAQFRSLSQSREPRRVSAPQCAPIETLSYAKPIRASQRSKLALVVADRSVIGDDLR